MGASEIFGEAGETEPTPGSPTADVTGMEAEEVGTAEPMGGSGQEAEIGAGAADLGERGGYIRPTGRKGRVICVGHCWSLSRDSLETPRRVYLQGDKPKCLEGQGR